MKSFRLYLRSEPDPDPPSHMTANRLWWLRNDWAVTLAGAVAGALIQGGMLFAFSSIFPGSRTLFVGVPFSAALIYGYLSYCAIRSLRKRLVSDEECSGAIRCTGTLSIACAFSVVDREVRGGPIRVLSTDMVFVSCLIMMNVIAAWLILRWVRLSNTELEAGNRLTQT